MPDTRMQERPDGLRHLAGFTLIEVVVVLIILSVLIAMGAAMTRGVQDGANRRATQQALDTTAAGLVQFVIVSRRLPCPADGALPPNDPRAGRELRTGTTCDNNQARGVVPWVTLGLKQDDAADGYGGMLTYRAALALVVDDGLMMVACDAAGQVGISPGSPGRCNPACVDGTAAVPASCTRVKDAMAGIGLRVQRVDGTAVNDPAADPATGAAYVLISHGSNHGGAYGRTGAPQEPLSALAAGETNNSAVNALMPFYVEDEAIDDRLMHVPVLSIALQAGTGPRPHRPNL